MTVVVPFKKPRGIRLNNPGNIRLSGAKWLGKIEGTDSEFETFDTPEHGVRALARILLTYQRKYFLRSVGAIISRWAPITENDTPAYVNHIANAMGVKADQPIDLENHLTLLALVTLIIRHECGRGPGGTDWYPQHDPDGTPGIVSRGVDMALEA
jgi:hypothetical protein